MKKVSARVVSVGNITWGGTGKTPIVIRLALRLADQGKKVAVLTRGYGGGDEVEEMKRELGSIPVFVGRDRAKSAERAIREAGAEILLLDDGFQHLGLKRDIDIVALNSTVPFGPGGLIPEGTLREPLESLKRADYFILTQANIGSKNLHWIRQKLHSFKPEAVVFEAVHQPVALEDPATKRRQQPDFLNGRKVATFCAIGDPYSFEKSVERLGAEVPFAARFEDHHRFTPGEIEEFVRHARQLGLKEAVTTEKDDVRLRPVLEQMSRSGASRSETQGFTFWVLKIEADIHDEEDLVRRCLHS
jgi:tetraacyldisaccharide 4'-kinase